MKELPASVEEYLGWTVDPMSLFLEKSIFFELVEKSIWGTWRSPVQTLGV
jgi:hypothetical protein